MSCLYVLPVYVRTQLCAFLQLSDFERQETKTLSERIVSL